PETTASPPRQTASAQQPPSGADVAAKNDALPETTASPPRERPLPILAIEAAPTASASPAQPDADADDDSAEPRSEPIPLSKPRQSKPRPDHRSKTELLAGSQPAEASNAEPSPAGDAAAPAVLDA